MHISSLTLHLHASEVYLLYAQGARLCAQKTIPARETSKLLIPTIASLLAEQGVVLPQLSYIACYRGPGSFTTVRSMIVTVNGLSFASKVPLVGFSGDYLPDSLTAEDIPHAAVAAGATAWSAQIERVYQLIPLYITSS